ncbi:Rieske 2Fe-2S domain-containing protein [Ramlibacter sp.]|uniref:Rieske 2Fe-2S domain-containing protein n=1 Tax=Ramlibacter sp. TaxID=1917967 RepID=UPI003D0B11C0
MLSFADNEMLTRTGEGTPMGTLFRRFWTPFLLSQELPEPDAPPVRVRVMGEDLVAFRDTRGRVGLVEPQCPHRGANLFWGRNEDNGLRCAFHGWKFDVEGRCVDMPCVPNGANYMKTIRLKSYEVEERGGMLWAYMGPPEAKPTFPAIEFTMLPASHVFVSKKLQECNWAQACEGGLDTAHFSYLHMAVSASEEEFMKTMSRADASQQFQRVKWMKDDGAPRFTIIAHDAGIVIGGARTADPGNTYWRISQFLMPNHGYTPNAFPGESYHGQTWIPIDDHSCWIYCYTWNPERPITEAERRKYAGGFAVHAEVDEKWIPIRNRSNDYLIDRVEQKHRSFTGITGVSEQDACIQDSQGWIADRTREHLGPTDMGVVQFRKLVLGAAKALAGGEEPKAAGAPQAYAVRCGGAITPDAVPLADVMTQRFGSPTGRYDAPSPQSTEGVAS